MVCLILGAAASATLLIARHHDRKIIEAEIELSNAAGKFVAPKQILDPNAIYEDLRGYEDPEPINARSSLPKPVAPGDILNPDSEFNFRPPVIKELE